MSVQATERLKAYLGALSPRAQMLLLHELQRGETAGENAAVARFVLEELRRLTARAGDDEPEPAGDEILRLAFRPLEPFLIPGNAPRAGSIRHNILLQAWQWLKRDAVAEPLRRLTAALDETADARSADRAFAISDFQRSVAIALSEAANAPPHRIQQTLSRIGPAITADDVQSIASLLRARDLLDKLARNLPRSIPDLSGTYLVAVEIALDEPLLQSPSLLPFALALTMKRLRQPWQILRLAIRAAGTDFEPQLLASPYGVSVAMAIEHVASVSTALRDALKRGHLPGLESQLATLHDGLRGVCAEIDARPDTVCGRQIAAIRAELSKMLRAEFDSIPMRVRRLLRQRVATDISPTTQLDAADVQHTVALIAFLAAARAFASELAVNEVTARVWGELVQYVGAMSELLIDALRDGTPAAEAFRRQQVDAAITISQVLFGADHAARMRRSADHAAIHPRQAMRTA